MIDSSKGIAGEIDHLKALGHGAVAVVNTAIILTIVAVVLSSRSGTPDVVKNGFAFLSWLVGQVVKPIKAGSAVSLTSTNSAAGGYGSSATSIPDPAAIDQMLEDGTATLGVLQ